MLGPDGKYHLYDPLYPHEALYGAYTILHGVADNVTGPYTWNTHPQLDICGRNCINPAFLQFTDAAGKTQYTLWVDGKVFVADNLDGPFAPFPGFNFHGDLGNPAPLWHNGAFYVTTQQTREVWTTPALDQPWTLYANITVPRQAAYEDPYMWIDKRGNWVRKTE